MNELGTGILKIMEGSSLGRMSVYILSKQTTDLGLDLNNITPDQVSVLAIRLKTVLPFFLADETEDIVKNIKRLATNGNMVMK
ncbi:MAG: hypothetical protein KAJ33_03445 [Thermoplasmata archaeon]|nr:hypothetical protein [Thermoplasmata archaeon]MCK5397284.1 hypothetical protein [Thermoplasmata archaeon]